MPTLKEMPAIVCRMPDVERRGVIKAIPVPLDVRNGYPLRASGFWYEIEYHRGVKTFVWPRVEHLTDGQHAGKFPLAWLKSLTADELLSLHSDDHTGNVDWSYVPGSVPGKPYKHPNGNIYTPYYPAPKAAAAPMAFVVPGKR